jgi:hypothetical protein
MVGLALVPLALIVTVPELDVVGLCVIDGVTDLYEDESSCVLEALIEDERLADAASFEREYDEVVETVAEDEVDALVEGLGDFDTEGSSVSLIDIVPERDDEEVFENVKLRELDVSSLSVLLGVSVTECVRLQVNSDVWLSPVGVSEFVDESEEDHDSVTDDEIDTLALIDGVDDRVMLSVWDGMLVSLLDMVGDDVGDFDCVRESDALPSSDIVNVTLAEDDTDDVADFDADATSCERDTLDVDDSDAVPELDAVSDGVRVISSDTEGEPLRLAEELSDEVLDLVDDASSVADGDGVPADFVFVSSFVPDNDVDDEGENDCVTSSDALLEGVPADRVSDDCWLNVTEALFDVDCSSVDEPEALYDGVTVTEGVTLLEPELSCVKLADHEVVFEGDGTMDGVFEKELDDDELLSSESVSEELQERDGVDDNVPVMDPVTSFVTESLALDEIVNDVELLSLELGESDVVVVIDLDNESSIDHVFVGVMERENETACEKVKEGDGERVELFTSEDDCVAEPRVCELERDHESLVDNDPLVVGDFVTVSSTVVLWEADAVAENDRERSSESLNVCDVECERLDSRLSECDDVSEPLGVPERDADGCSCESEILRTDVNEGDALGVVEVDRDAPSLLKLPVRLDVRDIENVGDLEGVTSSEALSDAECDIERVLVVVPETESDVEDSFENEGVADVDGDSEDVGETDADNSSEWERLNENVWLAFVLEASLLAVMLRETSNDELALSVEEVDGDDETERDDVVLRLHEKEPDFEVETSLVFVSEVLPVRDCVADWASCEKLSVDEDDQEKVELAECVTENDSVRLACGEPVRVRESFPP